MDPARLHGINFCLGRTAAAAYNCTGMPHASSRRRGQACNKSHHRFCHILSYKFSGFLFSSSADFANHSNTRSLRVLLKGIKAVYKVSAVYWITADTDTGGLPDPLQG